MIQQKDSQILYKYYPPKKYALKALSEGTICFTDLYSQNDPFEAMGFYRKTSDYESDKLFDSQLQELMDQHITDDDRAFLRNQCRIFCATTQCDRPLMWAHYAQSHRGICVGYHRQDIQKYCEILDDVKYRDHPLEKGFTYNSAERFLLLKATDWDYEKEVRGIYLISNKDCKITHTHAQYTSHNYDHDDEYIFFPMPAVWHLPDSINKSVAFPLGASVQARRRIIKGCEPCEVILGLCASQWLERQVKNICKKKHIPLYKAIQEDKSFEIDKIPVNL